jgi:hypothetical protein
VLTLAPRVAKSLSEDPNFSYRGNQDIINATATLFSRAIFVSEYLDTHRPIASATPITARSSSEIANFHIVAET